MLQVIILKYFLLILEKYDAFELLIIKLTHFVIKLSLGAHY